MYLVANCQSFLNNWTTPVSLIPDDLSFCAGKICAAYSDEDIGPGTYLKFYSMSGDSLSEQFVEGVDYAGTSAYVGDHAAFYIGGFNTLDSMVLAKTDTLGNLMWKKTLDNSGYEFGAIYKILPLGDKVVATYTLFTFLSSSVKSATGYYLLDTVGNIIYQSQVQVLPQDLDGYISYDAVIDQNNNVYIGSTNFEKSKLTKFNSTNGQVIWSKTFNQLDIQSMGIGDNDEIVLSGGDNNIAHVSTDGNLVYKKSMGDSSTHLAEQIIVRGNKVFTLGRYTPDLQPFGGAYIAQYDLGTGDRTWGWYWDNHNQNGEVYALFSGMVSNDSTFFVKGVGSFPGDNFRYFLAKLSVSGVSNTTDAGGFNIPFTAFPNPTANGLVTFQTTRTEGILSLNDASGKLLWRRDIGQSNTLQLPLPGLYFLHYSNGSEHFSQKLIFSK
jgi:hypothetical protein